MEVKNYEINSSKVISEALDGETIIINMENGNYFSMNETGTVVWDNIVARHSTRSIIEFLVSKYEANSEIIEQSVLNLLNSLSGDGLIFETTSSSNEKMVSESVDKRPFIPPKFEKYDDMQEMLLADPIHDVDAMGWPKLKEEK